MIDLLVIVRARPHFFDPALRTMNPTDSDPKASIRIGNAIAEMNKVTDFVDQFGAAHHLPQNITNDLNLCLDEILNNAISYGYDDKEPRSILVILSLSGDRMTAEIQDDGKPYDPWKTIPSAPKGDLQSRRIGGLGCRFVQELMDQVNYARVGQHNVLKIMKKLKKRYADGDR
jgi:anti-sigma regulatory factor (Ser/Thr protein kinase)